jgi:hypothetical protein
MTCSLDRLSYHYVNPGTWQKLFSIISELNLDGFTPSPGNSLMWMAQFSKNVEIRECSSSKHFLLGNIFSFSFDERHQMNFFLPITKPILNTSLNSRIWHWFYRSLCFLKVLLSQYISILQWLLVILHEIQHVKIQYFLCQIIAHFFWGIRV